MAIFNPQCHHLYVNIKKWDYLAKEKKKREIGGITSGIILYVVASTITFIISALWKTQTDCFELIRFDF